MSEFIREEVSIFIEAAWQGMLIAVCYDALRILRRVIKHKDIIVNIEDYLFWVIVGIAVFSMIFQNNDGVVRGYIFLALLTGAYTYHKSVSLFLVRYTSKILNFVITLLLKKPLKWAKMIIRRVLKFFAKPFKALGSLVKRKVKSEKKHKAEHEKHNKKKQPYHAEVKKRGKYNDKKKKKRKARNTGD